MALSLRGLVWAAVSALCQHASDKECGIRTMSSRFAHAVGHTMNIQVGFAEGMTRLVGKGLPRRRHHMQIIANY